MKNYLCILAAAALLASCGDKTTDVADTASASPPANENITTTENMPVVVTTEASGTFSVDARSDAGASFENKADTESRLAFAAKGLWSFAPAGGLLGPSGADAPAANTFFLPGAHSFGLVAKRGDGTFVYIGDGAELTLKPHEVIFFLMNDIKGGAADNRGSLKVTWTRK
jgi:hypothetical protein